MVTSQVNMSSVGGVMVHPGGGLLVISPSSCEPVSQTPASHMPFTSTFINRLLLVMLAVVVTLMGAGDVVLRVASDVSRV